MNHTLQTMFGDYRPLKAAGVQISRGARVTVTVAANRTAVIRFKRTAKNPVVFEIGHNARVTITDECDPTLPAASGVVAGPGSTVDYFINAHKGLPPGFRYQADLGTDARYTWNLWAQSSQSAKGSITINQATATDGRIVGGVAVTGNSEVAIDVTNIHHKKNSTGDITLNILGAGQARATINGLIVVKPRAL